MNSSKNNNIINNSDDKDSNIDISEKNIINNLFNLIDNVLSLPFEKFAFEVKNFNNKLILKAKETHNSKG
jgi:aminopeptidase C